MLLMLLVLLTMTLASLNLRLQLLIQAAHFRQTPCCCPGAKFVGGHSAATTAPEEVREWSDARGHCF